MKILIIGCGVIGTTYGYIFQKAGYTVEHLIRDSKKNLIQTTLKVKFLDGRFNKKGEEINDVYKINIAEENSQYDFIFVSVSNGKLKGVVQTLKEKNIKGTLVVMNGIWEERAQVDNALKGYDYVLGYPVAGGSINDDELDCCAFDHIMLESREKADIKNYNELLEILFICNINVENPFDMLEWIWLHMAVNAAVIVSAAEYGDINEPSKAAENLMNSSKILSETVLTIRETIKILKGRNVNLKNYKNELAAYKMPSKIAGIMMKRMFRKNNLTRSIMTLHNNINDLLYVCESLYNCGKENSIEAPRFYKKYEILKEKLKNKYNSR